jgi:hypothetical protein
VQATFEALAWFTGRLALPPAVAGPAWHAVDAGSYVHAPDGAASRSPCARCAPEVPKLRWIKEDVKKPVFPIEVR